MYIGDLHIHSRYSRATSRDCTPEALDLWARRKGIDILGTGDFTHPAWREELKDKLIPAEDGLYTLKKELRIEDGSASGRDPRFVLSGEISSIYKKNGRVRKVHNVILLPGLEEADSLAKKLEAIGNIHSDGRPILGLDCHDLLEIMLEVCEKAILIPAHIWTPHFSLFGAFSGFDTIEECFEDLTPYIHALETGLSSDPPMIQRLSALDSFQLISNSDAHSPSKLGREANLFDIPLCYDGLYGAIQKGIGLKGTIEFFPEEGKYHFDGHRKCHLSLTPAQAREYQNICPVCGKKLTMGVLHRIEELADREEGFIHPKARTFESLVPLPEVIASSTGRGPSSAKVAMEYSSMLKQLGTEFSILRQVPVEEIRKISGPFIAEGISRLRKGEVVRIPGFDGEYGVIQLLNPYDRDMLAGQLSFFTESDGASTKPSKTRANEPLPSEKGIKPKLAVPGPEPSSVTSFDQLNEEQQTAVTSFQPACAVIAGPGTGKTKTLIAKITYLISERNVGSSEITAVTFTNKAAEELRERLIASPIGKRGARQIQIGTFHSICRTLLKQSGVPPVLANDYEKMALAKEVVSETGIALSPTQFLNTISQLKSGVLSPTGENSEFLLYQEKLRQLGMMDFDDLLLEALKLLQTKEGRSVKKNHFNYFMVDELQDINPVQYELIKVLSKDAKEFFVIGDPDQSIYGFRGSDSNCFQKLELDFPHLSKSFLTKNYRSNAPILTSSFSLICNNSYSGSRQALSPVKKGGLPVKLIKASSEKGEAIWIAKKITELIGGIDMLQTDGSAFASGECRPKSFSDIAIFYRTHRQAKLLETCLRTEGIPYLVVGREDYLEAPSVGGTICFFRSLLDDRDRLSKKLCFQFFPSLAEHTYQEAAEKYLPLLAKTKPQSILTSWMTDQNLSGEEAMEKLKSNSVFYKNMESFLQALVSGEENALQRSSQKKYTSDAVTLMTLHGSKGLEFPVAILYGLKKEIIPFHFTGKDPDMEEERRLLYVGMTRAREELYLTTSEPPSPFLAEISRNDLVEEAARKQEKETAKQISLFDYFKTLK